MLEQKLELEVRKISPNPLGLWGIIFNFWPSFMAIVMIKNTLSRNIVKH
jgi:hypothetical protein